jgi:hypothetical protein
MSNKTAVNTMLNIASNEDEVETILREMGGLQNYDDMTVYMEEFTGNKLFREQGGTDYDDFLGVVVPWLQTRGVYNEHLTD